MNSAHDCHNHGYNIGKISNIVYWIQYLTIFLILELQAYNKATGGHVVGSGDLNIDVLLEVQIQNVAKSYI